MFATRKVVSATAGLLFCVGALGGAAAEGAPLPVTGTLDLGIEADLRIDSEVLDIGTGMRVAAAGDVNGDGTSDMIVGAPLAGANDRPESGSAYVLFGAAGKGPIPLGTLGARGLRIDGADVRDLTGYSVAGAGDVNGDGLADLLVGAPGGGGVAAPRRGKAYLVYGRKEAGVVDLAQPGSAALVASGAVEHDRFGAAIAGGSDVDGDGRPDFVVGAPGALLPGRGRTGAAYVITSGTGAVDATDLGTAGFRILGGGVSDLTGHSLALSPDVTGDKRGEILVGAPGVGDGDDLAVSSAGGAFQIFGQAGQADVDLAALGERGVAMIGTRQQAAGSSVAAIGDVNGDGLADMAVGAPETDALGREKAGSTFVVYSAAAAGATELPVPAGRGFRIDGAAPNDRSGLSVASIGPKGDFDGDGATDIVVGAPLAEPLSRAGAGAAYVVFGKSPAADVDLVALGAGGVRFAGTNPGEGAGHSVAAVGDVNADGNPDVVVHAPLAAPLGKDRTGATYLVAAPPVVAVTTQTLDPGAAEELKAGCKASKNAEFIIDDSGSMEDTDPDLLRRRAVELLIRKPRNEGKVVGALEFGDDATTVFSPLPLPGRGSTQDKLLAALNDNIKADGGSTNYNAGFRQASQENSAADTRIFLTDGAHNAGEYENLHKGGPRTFVLGLGIGDKGADAKRLARIAKDTGGRYFPSVGDEDLGTVMNQIDSATNCDIALTTDDEVVTDKDEEPETSAALDDETYSVDVTVSWTEPKSSFDLNRIQVRGKSSVIASLGAKALKTALKPGVHRFGKLRVQAVRGSTFATYRVSGVRGARLRTRANVRRLSGKRDTVTTQIAQSRRRR